jgi:branched-chain amino acid transport system permease protein
VIWQIVHSRVGAYLRAIRDDEEAASVMGLDTFKWKRAAFVISAAFAAVAGGFQGHYIGLLSPTPMKFNEMAVIIIMVIAGGFRTFGGPVLGAVFIEVLSEELRAWGEIRMVLFAVLVLVIVRAYPAGLWGLCQATARRLTRTLPRLAPLLTPQRRED